MFRTFLSMRYLRSRRTNLIGVVGIFVAVGALILILSVMTGFLEITRDSIRGSLSDLVITPDQVPVPGSADLPFEPDALLAAVRADPRVAAASAHLTWPGTVLAEYDVDLERMSQSRMVQDHLVQLVGIDPEDELESTELRAALGWAQPIGGDREGRLGRLGPQYAVADADDPFALPPEWIPSGIPPAGLIVGEQLMRRLDLRRGMVVNLATFVPVPGHDPERDAPADAVRFNNQEFVVAGAFRTRETDVGLDRVYLERWELQGLLGDLRAFSEVMVKLENYPRDAGDAVEDLRAGLAAEGLLRGLRDEVRTWEDLRAPLLGAIENERVMMGIMLSLVLVVAGFTVFAIISMMVTEKTRDIGILTAVGAAPRGVMAVFLMIGLWDALIGGILGAIAGVWGALRVDDLERWLSDHIAEPLFGEPIFDRGLYLLNHIPSRVEPYAVGGIVLGTFLCTLLCAAVPAWRAARIDPVSALRYE